MKVKGSHVLNAVRVLRAQKDRARELLPPRLHKYLDDRILPSSWYPGDEHVELLRAIRALIAAGGDADATWHLMGRGTARMDLTGIYKSFLRPDDPEGSMRWLAVMWKNAFDSGEVQVQIDKPGHATVRLLDMPLRTREICGLCGGYIVEALTMALGHEPEVREQSCSARGARDCAWSVQWS